MFDLLFKENRNFYVEVEGKSREVWGDVDVPFIEVGGRRPEEQDYRDLVFTIKPPMYEPVRRTFGSDDCGYHIMEIILHVAFALRALMLVSAEFVLTPTVAQAMANRCKRYCADPANLTDHNAEKGDW